MNPSSQLTFSSSSNENGFFLIEALTVLTLLAILSFSLMYSDMLLMRNRGRFVRQGTAVELALSKMEELAASNPTSLPTGAIQTETVTVNNMNFIRTTNIISTVNKARRVKVDVVGSVPQLGGSASLSSTFSPWGMK